MDEGVHRETNFPWIFDVKKRSLFKIPRLTDNLTSQELVEFLFTRRRYVLTLQYLFYKSYSTYRRTVLALAYLSVRLMDRVSLFNRFEIKL